MLSLLSHLDAILLGAEDDEHNDDDAHDLEPPDEHHELLDVQVDDDSEQLNHADDASTEQLQQLADALLANAGEDVYMLSVGKYNTHYIEPDFVQRPVHISTNVRNGEHISTNMQYVLNTVAPHPSCSYLFTGIVDRGATRDITQDASLFAWLIELPEPIPIAFGSSGIHATHIGIIRYNIPRRADSVWVTLRYALLAPQFRKGLTILSESKWNHHGTGFTSMPYAGTTHEPHFMFPPQTFDGVNLS
ncbi:MAG: hypothetical protein VX160_06520, partial [Actinomycetota bacterium]|nr:hypothetical protein [Actinomycetota bacterium]